MIDSLTDMSMEMTLTVEEADLKKLQEVLYDIKIEECPWFEVNDKYGKSAKYYRDGLSGWIPCKERLPEEYGNYLATMDDGNVQECTYSPEKNTPFMRGGWSTCEADGIVYLDIAEVVAWMPLPEPYREEGD